MSTWNDGTMVLMHHGIKGQKWGARRFQNPDMTYTEAGKERYSWASRTGNNSNNSKTTNNSNNSKTASNSNDSKTANNSNDSKTATSNQFAKSHSKIEALHKITQSKAFKAAVTGAVLAGGAVAVYAVIKSKSANGDCIIDEAALRQMHRMEGVVNKDLFFNDSELDSGSLLYRVQPREFENLPDKFFFATPNKEDNMVYQCNFPVGQEKAFNNLEIGVKQNIKIASVSSQEKMFNELMKNSDFKNLATKYIETVAGYTDFDKFIFEAPMDKKHPEAFDMFQSFVSSNGYGGIIDPRDINRVYGQGTKAPMIIFKNGVSDGASSIFSINSVKEITDEMIEQGREYALRAGRGF